MFDRAYAFNGDLSVWQVGKVTNMELSTYTLSLPLQDRVFFIGCFYFHSSFCGSTNSIFEQCSLLFFFSNPFLSLDFSLLLCCAVFNGAAAFNGDLSTWQVGKVTNMLGSTYTLSTLFPKDRVFFWLFYFPSSFCGSTNSIFEQCSLLFFFSTHFYPWTFLCCCGAVFLGAAAFNGDLSAWQVGKVTTMIQSTFTLIPLPLQDRVFFWQLLFPFFFLWQH